MMNNSLRTSGLYARPVIFIAALLSAGAFVTARSASAGIIITPITGQPVGAAAVAGVSTNFSSSNSLTNVVSDPYPYDPNPALILPPKLDNNQINASASTTGNGLGVNATGSAKADADLASGTLRAYASTSNVFDNVNVSLLQATAQAGFEDTLTAGAGGTMEFNIVISGTESTSSPDFGGTSAVINFFINGAPAVDSNGHTWGVRDEGRDIDCGNVGGNVGGVCNASIVVDVPVLLGNTVDFSLVLQVLAENATANFFDTLNLGVSGVTFTSSSGYFLTQPPEVPNGAPEPPGIALFGLGALLMLIEKRRRFRSASPRTENR